MNPSQGRVVVHFSTDDPSRDFSNLDEAIDFLGGSDWRCQTGRAWIEAPASLPAPPVGRLADGSIVWPPFSSEHSTRLH